MSLWRARNSTSCLRLKAAAHSAISSPSPVGEPDRSSAWRSPSTVCCRLARSSPGIGMLNVLDTVQLSHTGRHRHFLDGDVGRELPLELGRLVAAGQPEI